MVGVSYDMSNIGCTLKLLKCFKLNAWKCSLLPLFQFPYKETSASHLLQDIQKMIGSYMELSIKINVILYITVSIARETVNFEKNVTLYIQA
jgi:hypothetical protein